MTIETFQFKKSMVKAFCVGLCSSKDNRRLPYWTWSGSSVDKRIIGVWRNARTSVAQTASPIQRAAAVVNKNLGLKCSKLWSAVECCCDCESSLALSGGELNVMAVVRTFKHSVYAFVSHELGSCSGVALGYCTRFHFGCWGRRLVDSWISFTSTMN